MNRQIIDRFIAIDEHDGIYTVLVVLGSVASGSTVGHINYELENGEQLADLGHNEFGILLNGLRVQRIEPGEDDISLYSAYAGR